MTARLVIPFVLAFIFASTGFAAVEPPAGNPFSNSYGGVYAKTIVNGSSSTLNIDDLNGTTSPTIYFTNDYGVSGTLLIYASKAGASAQVSVKNIITHKTYNTYPGRSAKDYRTLNGLFRMVAVSSVDEIFEITITDSTYSSQNYYPILIDFLPDDPSAISDFNWFAAALNYEYKRWYSSGLYKSVSDVAGVADSVTNAVLALNVADAFISIGTSALTPSPTDSSKLLVDTNLIKDVPGTMGEINAIQKGVCCAIDTPVVDISSTVGDSLVAFAQCAAGNPLSAYQTIIANFTEASMWAFGVFKLNLVERGINARILVNKLLKQQLNDGNRYQYSDLYVRQQSAEFAEYSEGMCNWFEDKAGCGLDNYNEDTVVALYHDAWDQINGWIADRKRMTNYYPDVDNDGISNVDEIANGTDPNDSLSGPPDLALAMIAPSPGSTVLFDNSLTVRWGGTDDTQGKNVRVDLMRGGSVVRTLASSTANTGLLVWSVPTSLTEASDYTVRVSMVDDPGVYAMTGNFSILREAPAYNCAPGAYRVDPENRTNDVRQGQEVKIKVRGTDLEGHLDKVLYSVSDAAVSEGAIPYATSANARLSDDDDSFNDGEEGYEYTYVTFTGHNNGNPVYVYATVYDEEGKSDSVEWIFNIEPVYVPILTPVSPAETNTALPLGEHRFALNISDEDDNTKTMSWYLDGSFVSSSSVSGGNPVDDKHEDFAFTETRVYTVKAVATDEDGQSTTLEWKVNAGVAPDGNRPPVVEYLHQDTEVQYTKFRVGREYEFEGLASDADNNLAYVALLVDGVIAKEDTDPSSDNEDRTAFVCFTTSGPHTVSFLARDGGGLETVKTLDINVLDADSTASTAPQLLDVWPKGTQLSADGSSVHIAGAIHDAEFDTLYLDWYVDGVFSGRNDIEEEASFDESSPDMSSGNHQLKMILRDAAGNTAAARTWAVVIGTEGNHGPTIEKSMPLDGPIYVPQGGRGELRVLCSDPDGDLDHVIWNYSNVGDSNYNGSAFGYFDESHDRFTPTRSGKVTATVYDDRGNSSSVSFDVIVVPSLQGHAPTIVRSNLVDGGTYQIIPARREPEVWVDFMDVDGDLETVEVFVDGTLVDTFDLGGEFCTEDSIYTRGTDDALCWVDGLVRGETKVMTIRGTDSNGNTAEITCSFTGGPTGDKNHAPEVDATAAFTIDQRSSHRFAIDTADEEGDALQFTLSGIAEGNALTRLENNAFQYTPADDFSGTDTFTVNWADGFGGTAQTTVTATVNRVILPPRISPNEFSVTLEGDGVFDLGEFLQRYVITDGYPLESVTASLTGDTNCRITGSRLGGDASVLLSGTDNGVSGTLTGTLSMANGAQGASFTVSVTLLDTDRDGQPDYRDSDDDNDGMPDAWETANGLNLLVDDSGGNPDGDGLTNLEEYLAGTNPQVKNAAAAPSGVNLIPVYDLLLQ